MSLQADQVVVRYPSGFTVGPVSFTLEPGVHQLAGPNGRGKTTLLRALCADLPLAGGTVKVKGFDPHADAVARADIAWVPSQPEVPAFLTVSEAWQLYAGLRERPKWDGDLRRDALELPADLRVGEASSGQRARIELLCALAGDPHVLLLDEPFSHQDAVGRAVLTGWIAELRAEHVLVVVSHETLPFLVDGSIDF